MLEFGGMITPVALVTLKVKVKLDPLLLVLSKTKNAFSILTGPVPAVAGIFKVLQYNMEPEQILYRLQKALERRVNQLAISVTSGGVDNMETYKYIIGQINALESVRQEISNLQHDKELNGKSGTVIDLNRGLKNPPSK